MMRTMRESKLPREKFQLSWRALCGASLGHLGTIIRQTTHLCPRTLPRMTSAKSMQLSAKEAQKTNVASRG
jgi:hypothetical protein